MIYELTNPSDKITFHAPSDLHALGVAIWLGQGAYGAVTEKDENLGGIFFFAKQEAVDEFLKEKFGDLSQWIKDNFEEVLNSLESMACVDFHGREAYDIAIKADPSYKQRHNDKTCTSLNDICSRSWEWVAKKRAERKEEKENN